MIEKKSIAKNAQSERCQQREPACTVC